LTLADFEISILDQLMGIQNPKKGISDIDTSPISVTVLSSLARLGAKGAQGIGCPLSYFIRPAVLPTTGCDMRFSSIAAASSLGLLASLASADFVINSTRSTIEVGGASYDKVTFYAFNDGTGYTLGGTKLLALDINVNSTGVLRFETGHVPDSFMPPLPPATEPTYFESHSGLDIVLPAPSASLPAAEHTKLVSQIFNNFVLTLLPNNPNPDVSSSPTYDPVAAYTNRTNFAVVGAGLGVANGLPANIGLGAAFATIVTEVGSNVTVSGRIGGDVGTAGAIGSAPYLALSLAPEPTSLSALSALSLLTRRRR
jgi:hypothetical protein